MRTLKTKEGRLWAERLIKVTLRYVFGETPEIETGEGEGQGEISFAGFSILGMEEGPTDKFSVAAAREIPSTRWSPPDVDIIELETVDSLEVAIGVALKAYAAERIEQTLEGELMAMSMREED